MAKPKPDRIAELEAELKQRDRRIADLKRDLDKERELTQRLDEHLRDAVDTFDTWKQAFEMEQNDKGEWVWDWSYAAGVEWCEKYNALLKEWNKFVPEYNAVVRPRNVGRPIAASEAQQAQIIKHHKAGKSERWIAEEMTLSRRTVTTVIGKKHGIDRTTLNHLSRIAHDRGRERQWRAKSQSRKALPKRIAAWQETAAELHKEVKGLK
jgi:hypothetical protein